MALKSTGRTHWEGTLHPAYHSFWGRYSRLHIVRGFPAGEASREVNAQSPGTHRT
jgi:hypothetical protein